MSSIKKKSAQSDELVFVENSEVLDLSEDDAVIPFTFEITSYGADYPVDGLVKRIQTGDIVVPVFNWDPNNNEVEVIGFQREFVWTKSQSDRFIESLLLGLPVPGIFLVKTPSGVLLVLDGHQRLKTLQGFYEGVLQQREFKLEKVQKRFQSLRYKDLDPEDRRRLDNSIIHATIVRQEEPSEDQSSIYLIFERLNSGGTILQPQEIRVALYHGEFVRVLTDLNENPTWRKLYGPKSRRLKDLELILRFFALLYSGDNYSSPMKVFLNRYMASNMDLQVQSKHQLVHTFTSTIEAVAEGIGPKAFKPQRAVNAAILDAVMSGVAKRVLKGEPPKDISQLNQAYNKLLDDSDFQSAIQRATANEESVRVRLSKAESVFASVK